MTNKYIIVNKSIFTDKLALGYVNLYWNHLIANRRAAAGHVKMTVRKNNASTTITIRNNFK